MNDKPPDNLIKGYEFGDHIVDRLDSVAFAGLTDSELAAMRLHSESCNPCQKALQSARLSAIVVKQRSALAVEPSPFFQTRVLAALREQQSSENAHVFLRMWRSAGALVSSMALATAALAVFSFVVPTAPVQETASLNSYSAEGVILGQDQNDDQLNYEQALTIYEEGGAK